MPLAQATGGVIGADMRAGTVNQTGRDLDVAMQGDALLAVQAEDGSEAYTRRGDLQVSASGLVTTGDGRPVLGESGPLTLPPADSIRIADDGMIWIVPPGRRSHPAAADRPAEARHSRRLAASARASTACSGSRMAAPCPPIRRAGSRPAPSKARTSRSARR